MKNKNLCIIQARMGSTRLPGKVLKRVNGVAMLEYEIKRVGRAKKVNKIVVATSNKKIDDRIEKLCEKLGIDCFRGSENDVLDRYYRCSSRYPQYNNIIRIMGDCPLVDPVIIDETVSFFEKNNFDFTSNAERNKESFPDGLDVDVFKRSVLELAAEKAKLPSEREHVVPYIRENKKFKKGYYSAKHDFSHFRLVLDEQFDFEIIEFLIKNSELTDGYLHHISLLTKNPKVMLKNIHIKRNEGFLKSLKEDGSIKQ
jgi:spore coat polysaccharide biosynthesis protein SpsF (cytidylyltransferase family)